MTQQMCRTWSRLWVCLRSVSESFEVYKDFVGLHQVESTEAKRVYTDVLCCFKGAWLELLPCLVQNLVLWQDCMQLSLEQYSMAML